MDDQSFEDMIVALTGESEREAVDGLTSALLRNAAMYMTVLLQRDREHRQNGATMALPPPDSEYEEEVARALYDAKHGSGSWDNPGLLPDERNADDWLALARVAIGTFLDLVSIRRDMSVMRKEA